MKNSMEKLEKESLLMRHAITELRANSKRTAMTSPESYNLFTSIGCLADVLSLSCPDNKTITVTDAVYGKYADTCSGCCAPNPADDCTENVEDNRPGDWLGIEYYCNNQNSCEYQYQGSILHECSEESVADYLQIFYDCSPLDVNAPVAFTAYANRGQDVVYTEGDIVVYGQVVSNIGGHYNPDTSTFICPFDGVYMFEVTVAANLGYHSYIGINRDNALLVRAWAFGYGSYDRYHTSTAHTVTACTRGESVWVEAFSSPSSNTHHFEVNRYNHFSGFMIHNYEA